MSLKQKILILDDEQEFLDDIVDYFTLMDYEVTGITDGRSLEAAIKDFDPHVIIIDILLDGENGLKIIKKISGGSKAGIILLSNLNEAEIQVAGFEVGADAFLTKGTDLSVIRATVEAVVRRTCAPAPVTLPTNNAPHSNETSWSLNKAGWKLLAPNDMEVALNDAEIAIIDVLIKRPGIAVKREKLLAQTNKPDTIENQRYLDVVIQRLRNKIKTQSKTPVPIKSVYGKGYVFLPD